MINKTGYFIGLDIGTDSVGWAVTDENYCILKHKGKKMIGSRLFDSAKTAEQRRIFRSNRRRLGRKKQRIQLLQELFADEIAKKDKDFFIRLKNSNLFLEDKDKRLISCNTLFFDQDYKDKDYHKEFPTIYHLRTSLLKNEKQYDARLVYLAIHNIIKHRGHFLYEGSNIENVTSFKNVYNDLTLYLQDSMGITMECLSIEGFEKILKDKQLKKTKKKEELSKICNITKEHENAQQLKAFIGLISGTTEKLNILYDDEQLKDCEKKSVCFEKSYDVDREEYDTILQERAYLLDKLKAIYDWSLLSDILDGGKLNGKQYLSVSKVKIYEKHKEDLRLLKKVIKDQKTDDEYKEIFKVSNSKIFNYPAYIGMNKIKGSKEYVKRCNKESFYKYIGNILEGLEKTEEVNLLLKKLDEGSLLPLQITGGNGVIPYQVHKMELVEILDNASAYLPLLLHKDEESGLTVKDKIIKIFEFRIPYYVGPLNAAFKEKGSNSWIVRKEPGRILPWNFQDKVNLDASAEAFILRMTNECTYLMGEDVLPKNSLLYAEFMVWNELNNVKIRSEKLSVKLKSKIFNELFKTNKKVTQKRLINYLKKEGIEVNSDELTGFDKDFKTSLVAYHDFKNKVNLDMEQYSVQEMVEQIIFWMTIYSDGGKILKRKIKARYAGQLTQEQITQISRLKYSGWGKLSKTFLQDMQGVSTETGECFNIISALRNTNDNLMQLLSYRYTFANIIKERNAEKTPDISNISYDALVKDLYVSAAVKRSIWQTILITEEIKKVMKSEPSKIFIEMARGPEEKKRSTSRKSQLLELYKNIKDEDKDWVKEIEGIEESRFRNQKLFLYYTQMGIDLYTGDKIDLHELLCSEKVYDKDHIYPRSKTKDDSILNNLVLVNTKDNNGKGDRLVPLHIQKKMTPFWRLLKERKLITEEKFHRLTRTHPFTPDELAGFISRQIVETRQSTKAVATLLENIYMNSEIVYVKAQTVSDFRRDYVKQVKVRDLNDYHHAKDAYLNIVVGNVYHSKFTANPYKWITTQKDKVYSLNQMFEFDLMKHEKIIWKKGNKGTIKTVMQMMANNQILFTKYSYCDKGELFHQQMVKATEGKVPAKSKTITDLSKYGGYTSINSAYFMLVESECKGINIRTIESVPLYLVNKFESDKNFVTQYCTNELKLVNPNIRIFKIKKKAKIVINGFPMHISGHNGKQLELHVGAQLIVSEVTEQYIKKLSNYLARNTVRKDKKVLLSIVDKDMLNCKENIELYNTLCLKLSNSIYDKRPNNAVKTLENGRDLFIELTLEEQCVVLGEILHLFQCKPLQANLRLIGGSSSMGRILCNKKISSYKSVKLIHQSPTGLIEQEIDLLKI